MEKKNGRFKEMLNIIYYLIIFLIIPLLLLLLIKMNISWYSGTEKNYHSLNTIIIWGLYLAMVISLYDLREKKKKITELKYLLSLTSIKYND